VRVPTAFPGPAIDVTAAPTAPPRPLLTVVVPVYNGGDQIVENVGVIQQALARGLAGEEIEVIVVSDGSIDETEDYLLAARTSAGLRVIHYDRNLGKGYAVKAGALASHGEWVALVDSDLDLDPASVPEFLEIARREQLDFAIGSKRHPDSAVSYPLSRQVASLCYQQLNRLLFRLDVRDTQVGLKVFNRAIVDEVFPLLLVKRFAFDLELLAVASALGYGRVRELPIRLDYRFSGSELRSRAVVRALWDTAAIFYRLRILRTYQRKRALLRRASALLPEVQPFVSVIGDPGVTARLDYPRLNALAASGDELAQIVQETQGELIALLGEGERPAGNWVTAAVPFFADPDVAAVVAPVLTPSQATLRQRAAAAVLESRLGGASRRSRYFVGNVKVVADHPADSIIIRRVELVRAFEVGVHRERLVAWLAERRLRTIYTPDTSTSAPAPALIRPHLRSTYAYATARGAAARRTWGTSLSAATLLSLAPVACALAGALLLVFGRGALRDLGVGLLAAYVVILAVSTGLAALRFRSLLVGLLAAPALIATQATYVAGFARGIATRR
jgi:glycosyltransferase involved in cell wall biosynthesis